MASNMRGHVIGLLVSGLLWAAPALAQVPADPPPAKDMREEVRTITVTVKDLYGRQETRQIPVTIFRPRGEGRHPLVIMNHGRAQTDKRRLQGRQRFEPLSRYLVSKGFVVLLPTRVGYNANDDDFDPETTGDCGALRIEPMATAASDQVLATFDLAKTLPFIDTSRWLVMGQSAGGLATLATVYRHPPGLVAGINFAGGVGGNPQNSPTRPCSPRAIGKHLADKSFGAMAPMLWLYWENDQYWGADYPRDWLAAWVKGGGRAEMHTLPAAGEDGHSGSRIDMDHWVPIAETFLAKHGFTQSGVVKRPAATTYARIDEADKLPANTATREGVYRKFLDAKTPRAFAIGPNGSSGWARGDWAMGRAIGYCQLRGEVCSLYAIDDDVVWRP